MMTQIQKLIAAAAEAQDLFGDDILEDFAVRKCPRCSHGNVYEECPQCDSDAQQEIAGEYIGDDRIPDEGYDEDYQNTGDLIDDPDGGLDDPYYGFFPDTLDMLD